MREKPKDPERLRHIKEACEQLTSRDVEEWKSMASKDAVVYYGLVKLGIHDKTGREITFAIQTDNAQQ